MFQLSDCSGLSFCASVLAKSRQPAVTGPLAPPLNDIPAGCELQAKPAFQSFSEPEPATGCTPSGQLTVMLELLAKRGCSAQPFHAALTISEFSPKFGARKDVPQPPLMVRASIGDQLKPTFVLLVPPTSLYWSWRQEVSNSSRLM